MTPVKFPGCNLVLGRGQPEYQELHAHCDHSPQRVMTTCWELTEEEMAQVSQTGRIWVQQLTFGHTFQPQLVLAHKPETP